MSSTPSHLSPQMNAGSARLEAAIGIVENAHTLPDKPKSVVFDAQFNLGSQPFVVRFRHYNERGIQFQNGPQAFIISGPIVRIGENSIDLQSPVLDVNDYDAVGEAKTLIPVNSFDAVDVSEIPTINACGVVTAVDEATSTFELNIFQWTGFAQEKSFLPLTCIIPDTGRYKVRKPLPRVGSAMQVAGSLTGTVIPALRTNATSSDPAPFTRFCMSADDLTFLKAGIQARFPQINASQDVPNAPSKLKFKYKNMRASVPEESPLAHKSVPAADSAPKPKRVRLSMPTPADVQSAAASVSAPNEN